MHVAVEAAGEGKLARITQPVIQDREILRARRKEEMPYPIMMEVARPATHMRAESPLIA
jgi:hypothetical protein